MKQVDKIELGKTYIVKDIKGEPRIDGVLFTRHMRHLCGKEIAFEKYFNGSEAGWYHEMFIFTPGMLLDPETESKERRNLAFYKKSGEPWTDEECENIVRYVGCEVQIEYGDWGNINTENKYVFDDGHGGRWMANWSSQETDGNFKNCKQVAYEDVFPMVLEPDEIPEGTIVTASREKDGFTCQAKYYAKCGDKHAVDFNGTHAMIVDNVEVVPTMTKKEAKQRVSELFANDGKNVTSHKIREIIDLIEL